MNVDLDKWCRSDIDKVYLKKFSKKSDLKGIQHVSLFFGLLIYHFFIN